MSEDSINIHYIFYPFSPHKFLFLFAKKLFM